MSEKRRGLGRGIGALIPSSPAGQVGGVPAGPRDRPVDVFFPAGPGGRSGVDGSAADAGTPSDVSRETEPDGRPALVDVPGVQFADLPIGWIRANSWQPRQVFDQDAMDELVHSVHEVGVLQPIVVRPLAEPEGEVRFELIMGERRWRASAAAGLTTIPAIIRATDDDVMLRDALLENLHRSELNPLEEAAAYQQLLEDFGCTQDELARRIGRSRPQISNTIRLLRLPAAVQRRVAAGVLSAGHARALLALEDAEAAERLAQRIVTEGLSVRAVEEVVATQGTTAGPRATAPRAGRRLPLLDAVASRLSDRLDTRVTVALGKSRGRVTVEFATVEDLDRILSILDPGGQGVLRATSAPTGPDEHPPDA